MRYTQKHAHRAGDGSTLLPIMLKEKITVSSVIYCATVNRNTDIILLTVPLHAVILS